jgi:iron complex transport system substrate-binding protein
MIDLKKAFVLTLILALSLFASQACLGIIGKQIYPFKMKDEWGNVFKFTSAPRKIISCMPSVTELLFALDLENEIVGVTENCNYPEKAKSKEKVGRDKMNLERIVSLSPDLIVMYGGAQGPDIKKFRSLGLPVFVVDPETVWSVLVTVDTLGEATNRVHAAYGLNEKLKRKLNWTASRVTGSKKARPKVFVEINHKPLITAANGTFVNDMIEKAGGANIAKWAGGKYPEYSFEKLLAADPDVIIIPKQNISNEDQIMKDGKWMKLKAVRNGRVLFIDADLLTRPGPRVAIAVEQIATFLYEWTQPDE